IRMRVGRTPPSARVPLDPLRSVPRPGYPLGPDLGPEGFASPAPPLLLLGDPLDGRHAAIGHLAGEFDLAARDLALVVQLDLLIAELRRDGERHAIAFHLAIRDGRFAGERTRRLAGELVAVLFEGEGPLHRAVWPFRRCLPVAADVRGQCAEGE